VSGEAEQFLLHLLRSDVQTDIFADKKFKPIKWLDNLTPAQYVKKVFRLVDGL